MNNLQQLLAKNKTSNRKFECVLNEDGNEATVYLYDTVVSDEETAEWWGGVAPESFVKALNEIDAPLIHLRINSPGGDVFAARAIEAAIRQHKSKVVAHIDGYAASAASYIAVACDEVEIAQGGFFMIHKAWTLAWGNSNDLLKTADLLDKIDQSLVKTYESETKLSSEDLDSMMAEETWIGADDAVEYGFADRVAEDKAKDLGAWDLNAYKNAPKPPEDDNLDSITDEHRARQQQRVNMLRLNRIR